MLPRGARRVREPEIPCHREGGGAVVAQEHGGRLPFAQRDRGPARVRAHGLHVGERIGDDELRGAERGRPVVERRLPRTRAQQAARDHDQRRRRAPIERGGQGPFDGDRRARPITARGGHQLLGAHRERHGRAPRRARVGQRQAQRRAGRRVARGVHDERRLTDDRQSVGGRGRRGQRRRERRGRRDRRAERGHDHPTRAHRIPGSPQTIATIDVAIPTTAVASEITSFAVWTVLARLDRCWLMVVSCCT